MRSQYAHFRGLEIALLAQPIDPPRGSSSSRGRVVRVVGSVGWALFRGVCGVCPSRPPKHFMSYQWVEDNSCGACEIAIFVLAGSSVDLVLTT